MGTTAVAYANRKTRTGNEAYYDTDEPLPWMNSSNSGTEASAAPSEEARTAATTRQTGGTASTEKESQAAPVAPRKGRRGRTLASLEPSVNKPSILGG